MKRLLKKIFLYITILIAIFINFKLESLALSPKMEKLIEITNFRVIKPEQINIDSVVNVLVSIKSKISGPIKYQFNFSGGLSLENDSLQNQSFVDTISVNTDSIINFNYTVKVRNLINSGISFGVKSILQNNFVLPPASLLNDVSTCPIALDYVDANYLSPCFGPVDEYPNSDNICQSFNFTFLNPINTNFSQERTPVNISGKILFRNYWEESQDNQPFRKRSAYNNVWLFFRKTNKPDERNVLYHPIELVDNKPIENIHFSRCDEEGNYSFNFSFLKDSLYYADQTATWEILLFIAKENEAIILTNNSMNGTNHSLININNPDKSNKNEVKVYPTFFKPVTLLNLTQGYNLNNINYDFEQFGYDYEGSIFRHSTLSRRFISERRNIPLNSIFIPPQIDYYIEDTNVDNSGFYSNARITSEALCTPTITIHEYGHYYHDFLNGIDGNLEGNSDIYEGFACFFFQLCVKLGI